MNRLMRTREFHRTTENKNCLRGIFSQAVFSVFN